MDILIQKNETEDVFRVMKSLGYVQGKYNRNTHTIDKFDNNRLNGYESELQHYGEFVKLSGSDFFPIYSVDVHHRLSTIFDSFYYDSNLLFQRAKKENIQGINACYHIWILHFLFRKTKLIGKSYLNMLEKAN